MATLFELLAGLLDALRPYGIKPSPPRRTARSTTEEDVRKYGASARRPVSGRAAVMAGILLVGVAAFISFFWYAFSGVSFSH